MSAPMSVTRAVPPDFPSNHTASGSRMLQHALTAYEKWQKRLYAEVHSTALATADNRASENRKANELPLTQEQKEVLLSLFVRCIEPTTREKHDLAKEFGVTRDKIDVSHPLLSARNWALPKLTAKNWFQNRRTISGKTAKRKPQGAHANLAFSSESHAISSHRCQNRNRRTVAPYAAKLDSTSQYISVPGPDKMPGIAYVPWRTGSREFSTNSVHRGSKRNMYQQQRATGTMMNQAPAMFCHNASQISGVQSNTVPGQIERPSDRTRQLCISIECFSSVPRPALSHTCSTRLTHHDNPPYSTALGALVLAETARAEGTRSEAKHPTLEPPVNFSNFTKRGSDFFPAFIPR
ncbi:hypothetical protein Q7P35_005531 [Cladosporium inversicolor]